MKLLNLITLRRVAQLLKVYANRCKNCGRFAMGLKFSNAYYEISDCIQMLERK
jgi:hypothetical protein